MPNKSKLTDKDRTQEQIESLLKPVRLKDLEGGPETWNTASNAEALYRIFNVKQYVVDEDYILDPYTSNRPQSLAYRISDIIKHSDEHFRKRCNRLLKIFKNLHIDYNCYQLQNREFVAESIYNLQHYGEQDFRKKDRAEDTPETTPDNNRSDKEYDWAVAGFLTALQDMLLAHLHNSVTEEHYKFLFQKFVDCVYTVGGAKDTMISYVTGKTEMTFLSPVDKFELRVMCKPDLIIQKHAGLQPSRTVAVVKCKPSGSLVDFKYTPAKTCPESKQDKSDSKQPDKVCDSSTFPSKDNSMQNVIGINTSVCRVLTANEVASVGQFLPQFLGEMYTSFNLLSVFSDREFADFVGLRRAYRLGIAVLGVRVMFIAVVIVDTKHKMRPIPENLPISLYRKQGLQTDVFISRQFDLLCKEDRVSLAKILLAITLYDKLLECPLSTVKSHSD